MRKYPIGLQDFMKIRQDNFLYVDKTKIIHQLISSGAYFFLSRPRRFGKSLLLSTIKEIFMGNKELFKGLWIEDHWNWEKKNPVIHLALSQINYEKLGLYETLNKELDIVAGKLGVALQEKDLKDKFRELIEKTAAEGRVVILIDEYDKPIIDYLDDLPKAQENRAIFKSFYSVLKDSDEYIRLLLITGVSRFSKVSIFSDLNNLYDITLNPHYSTLVGITQDELEKNFAEEISSMQVKNPAILKDIKKWYNGYSWDGENTVYNPFSLLGFMGAGIFNNFWYDTGTPTFLVKLMQKKKEYNFSDIHLSGTALGNFDIDKPDSPALLFQTGYLTIKGYDPSKTRYTLDYPNLEVEDSLVEALLSAYRYLSPGQSIGVTDDLSDALEKGGVEKVIETLNAVISSIPYDHWKADHESIFHIIIHLTFKKIGVGVDSEVHSAKGPCDVLIKTDRFIYAIELKLNSSARQALDQIQNKGYLKPFTSDPRKKIALGINFSSETREVAEFEVKEFQ
ncbi:MAG TPA: AAA family ATPase [Puia sp.]|nr:AAA family ATPase [Puia sp.]